MASKCWSSWWNSRISLFTRIPRNTKSLSCQIRRRNRFRAAQIPENSLGVREGDVRAEADHAEPGGNPLATPECGAGLELASKRSGERNDEQVRSRIQGDGD